MFNLGTCCSGQGIRKAEHKSENGGMVKSVCSLHTAVLQILLQSLNQDLGSALLLLRGDTESSQESKTPRRYSILPIQALHIDCLVSHAILFHVHEAVRFISLLFNPQGTSTRP